MSRLPSVLLLACCLLAGGATQEEAVAAHEIRVSAPRGSGARSGGRHVPVRAVSLRLRPGADDGSDAALQRPLPAHLLGQLAADQLRDLCGVGLLYVLQSVVVLCTLMP